MIGYLELGQGPEQAFHAVVTRTRFRGGSLQVTAEMMYLPQPGHVFKGYRFYGEDDTLIYESPVEVSIPHESASTGDIIEIHIEMVITHVDDAFQELANEA